MTHDTRVPVYPRPNKQLLAAGKQFENFRAPDVASLGDELGGVVQKFVQIARAKSMQAKLGQNVLLPA
jgi:hypothetical protein